jgi:hypothetical protein
MNSLFPERHEYSVEIGTKSDDVAANLRQASIKDLGGRLTGSERNHLGIFPGSPLHVPFVYRALELHHQLVDFFRDVQVNRVQHRPELSRCGLVTASFKITRYRRGLRQQVREGEPPWSHQEVVTPAPQRLAHFFERADRASPLRAKLNERCRNKRYIDRADEWVCIADHGRVSEECDEDVVRRTQHGIPGLVTQWTAHNPRLYGVSFRSP